MSLPILSTSEKRILMRSRRLAYNNLLNRFEAVKPQQYVRTIQEKHPQLDTDTIRNLFNRKLPQQLPLLAECIKVLKPDFKLSAAEIELITPNAA